ncbi:uncharacterized protein LOC124378033 [Silurus meridionalis]|uniref:uncharacterized protein LOC124378033 n=1 Tax=Silurus meridionalis TaxID=175797 RepID=UPI001EEADFC9|nr:uncharacterized protein LOC124378033 [Silurus meridionalis]
MTSGSQIIGYMVYNMNNIQDKGTGNDTDTSPTPSPTTPQEETSSESATTIDGSVSFYVELVFSNSSTVPSECSVLRDIEALLQSAPTNPTDSVTVIFYTYGEISNTSFTVKIIFSINNISMPKNPDLRNDTYIHLESIINKTVNTLLNDSGAPSVESTTYNFMSSGDQVTGHIIYSLEGCLHQPENDTSPTLTPTTTLVQTSPGSPTTIDGSAVVNVRMVFHNSISVPSEDVVLSDFKAMLNSTLSKFPNSVTVQNVTYEPISNTSFVVLVTFSISSISMPEDPALRNDTYTQVKVLINDTVNTVLNNSGTQRPVELTSYNFKSLGDQVTGYMEYSLQSLLSQPENDTSPTLTPTTTLVQTSPRSPTIIDGSAVVYVRMVFENYTSVPSSFADIKNLNNSVNFSDSLTVLSSSYNNISNTSFEVNITFVISNINNPENPELRNNAYVQAKTIVNNAVNTLLTGTNVVTFAPNTSSFMTSGSQIIGYMVYNMNNIQDKGTGNDTETTTVLPTIKNGIVLINISIIFENMTIVPSEAAVLKAANEKLVTKIRTKRGTQKLDSPVQISLQFNKTGSNSFRLDMEFKIFNVSLPVQCNETNINSTYELIQQSINSLMNSLMTAQQTPLFSFPRANYTCDGTALIITANEVYRYKEGDFGSGSAFLVEILRQSGMVYYIYPALDKIPPNPKPGNSSYTGVAWILGFIIPCAIVLILLPFWILLCCILCGCCAGIRRRWRRRQSYNVQYQTHNSLF